VSHLRTHGLGGETSAGARRACGWIALAAMLLSRPCPAVQDPSLKWKTISTDHFRITYHSGLEEMAVHLAAASEEARRRLIVVLGYEPKQKVEVTLVDQVDDANALTMVVPFNTILVYATAPPDLSTLENYDDWMLALMVHEYTHVLHLDNWGGIVTVLNHIMGKQYLPNGAQPLWVLEGYAVIEESTKTGGGRLGSTMWDMYLRMAALEDRLLPIDEASSGTMDWPHGSVAYLYGSYFLKWVVDKYGEEILWLYAEDYGNDLIPFGINRDIKKITGKTCTKLWDEWRAAVKEKVMARQESVMAAGLREGIQITFSGETDRSPRFSPDGKMVAWYAYDGHDRGGIHLIDLKGPRKALADLASDGTIVTDCDRKKWKPKKILEITGQASLAFTPDGGGLVYSRDDVWKGWYDFHDLYYLDLGDPKHPERLTYGRRARQPDLAPDGMKLVFTKNSLGSSRLVVADDFLDPDRGTVVDALPPMSQAYSPRFSPDGSKIAYSAWTPGGKRDIRIVDLETGKAVKVTDDRYVDTGPAWAPDGGTLYFCSDRTGISNVYAYDMETKALWQVTNVMGGAYMPDVSPDGRELVYIGYRSKGFDLWLMTLDREEWVEADGSLPGLEPDKAEADLSWSGDVKTSKPKMYNPLRTLYPRAWTGRYEQDGFGQALTLIASGMDIAGQHGITASLHIGLTGKTRIGYSLDYGFYKLPVNIYLSHARYVAPQGGLRVDDQWQMWPEIGYRTALSFYYPISFHDFTNAFSLTYRLTYMTSDKKMDTPIDPNAAMPVLPDRGYLSGFELGWSFSNIQGSTFGVSAEQGGSLWTSVAFDLPQLGSDYKTVSVSYGTSGYFEIPFLEHHVIAARFAGGYGSSTFSRKGVFVVGGFPEEDILNDLINRVRMWSVALRGYAPAAAWGDQYYLLSVEYRLPLLDIFRGILTFPWQLERIYLSVFTDTGGAWWAGGFNKNGIKTGLGAELFVSMKFVYYEGVTFRMGYAYGFMDRGGHHVYVVLSTPF
jgi:hypothetical protein